MSFWEGLAKGGAEGLATGVGSLVVKIREAITGEGVLTSEERLKIAEMTNALEMAAQNLELEVVKGQTSINLEEAKSDSLFKSGWRPAVAWVCAAGLVYTYLVKPILPWTIEVMGILGNAWFGLQAVPIPEMPSIPMAELFGLLAGMLGLGVQRMFEKKWGVASK